jgi:hypothetical protein
VDGKFSGTDVDASAAGTLTPSGNGTLDVSLRAADSRLPRRGPSGAVPVDLRGHVAIDGSAVALSDLAGRIAGANVKGRLAFGLGQPLQVNGRIEADQVDAAELIALFTGTPRARGQSVEWPAEPFVQTTVPPLEGRVEFRAATARWAAGLVTRDLAGAARFEPSGLSLTDVTGTLADGRLALDAQIRREPMGILLNSHVKLTNADLPVLFAGALRASTVGRISLDAEAQGQGLSAASLVGALKGSGTVTEHVEITGLDPTAIIQRHRRLERSRPRRQSGARWPDRCCRTTRAGSGCPSRQRRSRSPTGARKLSAWPQCKMPISPDRFAQADRWTDRARLAMTDLSATTPAADDRPA